MNPPPPVQQWSMNLRRAFAAGILVGAMTSSVPGNAAVDDPLRFFEGATEAVTTMKIIAQQPFVSYTIGTGRINGDGSLELLQHVKEEGRRQFDRLWRIHQVSPGRFIGTMTEARGTVNIERVGNRYRFRFVTQGNMAVEQWITPARDATVANTQLTVRKFGIVVAHGSGWIRRSVDRRIASASDRRSANP